jgi:hypothetical protein
MSRKGGKPAGHFPADRMSLDRVGRPVGPLHLPVCFASDRPADGRPCDAQQLGRLGGASSPEFGSASRWRRTPFRLRVDGFRDQPGHSTGTKNGQAGVGRFGLLATRASRQPRSTLATARPQVALQALAHGTAST